jgi:primosomal protein N' (replication factor Y)
MYVDVVLAKPIDQPLTYQVPEGLEDKVSIGHSLIVPFRRGTAEAYVIKKFPNKLEGIDYAIKPLNKVINESTLFDEKDLQFYKWVADYYQSTLGEVLFSAIPKVFNKGPRKRGANQLEELTRANHEDLNEKKFNLTEDQELSVNLIAQQITKNEFNTFLLYGVTGSGKTEVYLQSAERAINAGKSVIILVPEIALTPQLRSRFISRFQNNVAVLHSSLAEADRRDYWWQIRNGIKKIVVGARSALFAPVQNLGLIVVDEEHEPTYKQEGHLRYNARDLALVKAQMSRAAVVLGSATPSIESYQAATSGRYTLLRLKTRPQQRPHPKVNVVDMRLEKNDTMISDRLKSALVANCEKNEQSIVFLNRKGFSHHIICKDCGQTPGCPNCSVTLTYYKQSKTLRCHYCDYVQSAPTECNYCAGRDFRYVGYGTETVYESLIEFLPKGSVRRLDAEAASNSKKLEEILREFRSGDIKVLVGTQMLAKGHDFPNVTLIGVVLAESGLHIPDYRAGERTYQLLAQVAGRAGRADKPGEVIMQTYMPDHPVIARAVANDYEGFFADEIAVRKDLSYPPFSRLAQIEFRSKNEHKAQVDAQELAQKLLSLKKDSEKLEILGPAPAAITRVANEFRWQLTLKAEKISVLNSYLKTSRRLGARLIDVDPMNTL